MTITENIVRMMNGSIDVQSEPGKGSRFTVSVPLELCLEKEEYGDELAGLPVLVVDDDRITCESAAALLDELGMRGHWVMSGREAVHLIVKAHEEKDDYFAVILDWKMPEMDGLETVRAIREELGTDVPIIIVSAYDYSEIEDEFLRQGQMRLSQSLSLNQKCCRSSMYSSHLTVVMKEMCRRRIYIPGWTVKRSCWQRTMI